MIIRRNFIKIQHHIASEEMLSDVPRSDNFKEESLFLMKGKLLNLELMII